MMAGAFVAQSGRVAAPCAPFSGCVARPSLSRAARGASVTTCAIQTTPAASKVRVNDGPDMWSRTYYPTKADAAKAKKDWYIVDAEGQTLGRLATMVASYIRGKHLATYTPSMDMGAYVVVINSEKVAVSGKKEQQKTYFRHSTGRPGKHHTENLATLRARLPERIVERAVKGMLPKGRLGRALFNHLKVYKGSEHPHDAQQPIDITNRINKKASAVPAS